MPDILERLKASRENVDMLLESARVDALANKAATSPLNDLPEPTLEQKESGEYQKGLLTMAGFDIAIENPKGSLRKGVDPNGNEWSIELKHHYGDFVGTVGADGDPIDVFLGDNETATHAFVVNQVNEDKSFDEHKVMLGFNSKPEARQAYLSNYEDGWQGAGAVVKMSLAQFESWLSSGRTNKPATVPVPEQ